MLCALYILKMEHIKFQNVSEEITYLNKKSDVQKDREFILSKIDKEFYKNKKSVNDKDFKNKIKELVKTKYKFRYNHSYAYFDDDSNIVIDYFVKGKFYKEEIYNVKLDKENLKYENINARYNKKEVSN